MRNGLVKVFDSKILFELKDLNRERKFKGYGWHFGSAQCAKFFNQNP
jgi:hypothetical protein